MKTRDEIEYGQTLQEIVMVCLSCGTQKPTGTFTSRIDFDNQYAYSHGYCSVRCAEKQYPGVTELFSQYDLEDMEAEK